MIKETYFPKQSKWIFLFLLLVLSLFYNYHQILFRPPGVIHQWRQCDCLSLAANYYHHGMHFFSPAVYFAGHDGTGQTASEFPIIYYLVALLWKVFGQHEFIFRLVNLSIVYTGLFFLFRFVEEKLKDSFWAILLTLLVFTSPILVYYSNGFIMDPLGLSFAFIAWYYFGKFYESGKNAHLYLCMLFFGIGGLLKVSSSLSYFAILGVFAMEMLGANFKENAKIFTNKKKQIIPFILVGIGLYCWYSFAQRYNLEHASGIFLVGILPIWDYSANEIAKGISNFQGAMTLHQFYNIETLYLIFIFFFIQIVLFKKSNPFLLFITVLLFFAVIAFLVLWFGAVTVGHDYYLTNLLVFVAFGLISFFAFMQKSYAKIFSSEWFKMSFALILVYNVYLTSGKTAIRYFNTQDRNFPTCYSKDEIALLQWAKYDFQAHSKQLREVSPYLRSLGIKPEDKVLSLPDISFDITLYFMNQPGWTQSGAPVPLTEDWIDTRIQQGAKYLIVNDPAIYSQSALSGFTAYKLGSYKNIDVYDLTKKAHPVNAHLVYDLEDLTALEEGQAIKSGIASSGKNACILNPLNEYGLTIRIDLKSVENLEYMQQLTVSANYLLNDDAYKGTILVFQIKNSKDSVVFWKPIEIDAKKSPNWQNLSSVIQFNNYKIKPSDKVNVYAYNTLKKNIAIDDINLIYKGYK